MSRVIRIKKLTTNNALYALVGMPLIYFFENDVKGVVFCGLFVYLCI